VCESSYTPACTDEEDWDDADSLGQCKPHRSCDCSQHGDVANDDGILDMLDVMCLVYHLFAGADTTQRDLSCPHVNRGDLDCDNFGTALDLCALIDVVFAGKDMPCQPCTP
jgi:hypothetical protein